MNLSFCFDSVHCVRRGGSLHGEAAVEGEWEKNLLPLKHPRTVDLS